MDAGAKDFQEQQGVTLSGEQLKGTTKDNPFVVTVQNGKVNITELTFDTSENITGQKTIGGANIEGTIALYKKVLEDKRASRTKNGGLTNLSVEYTEKILQKLSAVREELAKRVDQLLQDKTQREKLMNDQVYEKVLYGVINLDPSHTRNYADPSLIFANLSHDLEYQSGKREQIFRSPIGGKVTEAEKGKVILLEDGTALSWNSRWNIKRIIQHENGKNEFPIFDRSTYILRSGLLDSELEYNLTQ